MTRKKNKAITINELFCGMPFLREYFKEQERIIKKFGEGTDNKNPTIERLKARKRVLLDTAKRMRGEDLQIIYYLHTLSSVRTCHVLNALKKIKEAEIAFNVLLQQDDKDVMAAENVE